jgi:hypothetical protein
VGSGLDKIPSLRPRRVQIIEPSLLRTPKSYPHSVPVEKLWVRKTGGCVWLANAFGYVPNQLKTQWNEYRIVANAVL